MTKMNRFIVQIIVIIGISLLLLLEQYSVVVLGFNVVPHRSMPTAPPTTSTIRRSYGMIQQHHHLKTSSLSSLQSSVSTTSTGTTTTISSSNTMVLNGSTMNGYGLSSSVQRIFDLVQRPNDGYYKAYTNDTVITVMEQILQSNNNNYDIALIYDTNHTNQLVGIFTETDYIRYSTQRAAMYNNNNNECIIIDDNNNNNNDVDTVPIDTDDDDIGNIVNYMTPISQIIGILPIDTVSTAISLMQQNSIRHLVLTNTIQNDSNRTLCSSTDGSGTVVYGVISMKDIMSILQQDEIQYGSTTTSTTTKMNNKQAIAMLREELKNEANTLSNNPITAKEDIIKFGTVILAACIFAAFFSQSIYLHEHADIVMISIFILGYIGIIFEEVFEFNKAGVALLMSTGLWVTYADYFDSTGTASNTVLTQLSEQLADVSDICFFLLAASTIVEVVDSHQGFRLITNQITTTSKKQLFWTIGFITFFLSSILNNLTVTIVMVSLLRKIIPNNDEDRKLFGAMVVVAANAGGVWTPIGDVTTTMLWINNQLSTINTITDLALPSIVCLVASLAFLVNQVEEDDSLQTTAMTASQTTTDAAPLSRRGQLVFVTGIVCLLAVPVFTELTGLPPYLAMLTGLGAMWTLTDIIHMGEEDGDGLKVPAALEKLDTSGILFFLGILMSIGVLDKSGLLKQLAVYLSDTLPSLDIIATAIGLFSALIDNVPLVAATMGMYDLSEFGTDDKLWQLIALCAGTGGSILVIGSSSGVALMGLEKVDFVWYAKKVSIGATIGYFAGIATYLAQYALTHGGVSIGSLLPQAAVAADIVQQGLVSVL